MKHKIARVSFYLLWLMFLENRKKRAVLLLLLRMGAHRYPVQMALRLCKTHDDK